MNTRNIFSSLSELVEHLELVHHIEGGFYRQNYRSKEMLKTTRGIRSSSTSIYYCLPSNDYSVWHKLIGVTERIHFHYGNAVIIYTIDDGKLTSVTLDDPNGDPFVVNPNTWFAIKPCGSNRRVDFSLMSCVCEPGFDYADLVIADNRILTELNEQYHELTATLLKPEKCVYIVYRNYKGNISNRKIIPKNFWYGHTHWHPEDQYLLDATDMDKNEERSFAMKDILTWSDTPLINGDL